MANSPNIVKHGKDPYAMAEDVKRLFDESVMSLDVRRIVKLTQAEYDALTPVDTTLYVIVG